MSLLEKIRKARETIKSVARCTPLDHSQTFSEIVGKDVFLKLENLQKTGSFKVRGAFNKLMTLDDVQRKRGVVAASAGNHAQGVAFGSSKAGIESTIVMPEGASIAKIEATKKYGANVVLHGDSFDEAMDYAQRLCQKYQASFIHAFDDEHVIAGQGTLGLEIMEQLPDVDVVICPIGGGGLISGIAAAIKETNPKIKVYGVQAASCASMISSLGHKKPLKIASSGTIADGIAVKQPGEKTLELVKKYVDDIFLVEELEIARTMLYLLERSKNLVEGSGAASLAAALYDKLPLTKSDQKLVTLISGGNVDVNFVSRIIERGLVESGRFITFMTKVLDKPGYLNRLLEVVAQEKANVISIQHHRIGLNVMPGQTEIELSLETRDHDHIQQIEERLNAVGFQCIKKT